MANPKLQVEIGAKLDALTKGLKEASAKIEGFSSEMNARMKSVGEAIQSIAVPAGVAAAAIGAIGLSAVKSYGRLQSLEKGLEAVAGSSGAAKKQLDDLREVAKLPGLGLEEAVRGSISLQAIGISAADAKEAILQFGNAVATVGKGRAELDRALYGLQQLANTDFPLGEDLNIIKDAIPQVSKLLTEAFGANRSDELAKMGITSKQVVDVILKGLSELPRVAGGVENAIENMQDSLTEAWRELGKAISETLNFEGAMNKLGDALGGVVEWFRELDPKMREMIVYIGAGTTAFLGLVAAAGAIITIAPLVLSSLTAMTAGIAALTAAVGVGAVYIATHWNEVMLSITKNNADFLGGVSKLLTVLANLAGTIGSSLMIPLQAAAAATGAASKNLARDARIMGFEMHILEEQLKNLKTGTDATTPSVTNLGKGFDDASKKAKRLGLDLIYLNGVYSLSGKAFDPNKKPAQEEEFRKLDRGVTLAPVQVSFDNLLTEAEINGKATAEAFNEGFASILQMGLPDLIADLASSLGSALASGGNVIESMGQALLGGLGSIMVQLGKMAIQTGIAIGAVKTALKSLNPVVAIAAGVALVAIGSAFSAGARSLGDSIGGQGSGGGSQVYTSGTVLDADSIDYSKPQLFLKGSDIYIANKIYEAKLGRG